MPVTVRQIAELAGVSRGTVDRALNNRGNVKPEVERRIREIAAELGYTPNRAGKALAYQRKDIRFGIVVNAQGNEFFDEVLRGARTATDEYADFGIGLEIRTGQGYDVEQQLEQLEELRIQRISAIAITPINLPEIARKMDQLMEEGIQVITLNSDIEGSRRLCYVGCNYYQSGVTAGGLLRLLRPAGVRAGIITGSVKMLGHNRRISGFSDMLRQLPDSQVVDLAESLDDNQIAYEQTLAMLQRHPDINTLYFAAAGAAGGARAAEELGARLTTISCDDTREIAQLIRAGNIQATVCQEPFRQGYRAMQILFEAVVNGVMPTEQYCYMDNIIRIRENLQ